MRLGYVVCIHVVTLCMKCWMMYEDTVNVGVTSRTLTTSRMLAVSSCIAAIPHVLVSHVGPLGKHARLFAAY